MFNSSTENIVFKYKAEVSKVKVLFLKFRRNFYITKFS